MVLCVYIVRLRNAFGHFLQPCSRREHAFPSRTESCLVWSNNIILHFFFLCLFVCLFVYVSVPPQITLKPKDHIANEMDNVTFHCAASGKPEPTINWTRDGHKVGSGQNLNITAQTNLSGSVYKCTAENGFGQPESATATLTVKAFGMIIHYSAIRRLDLGGMNK